MSKYPTSIDTDAELPRIDDNVTEIGSEALNAMRESIIAIQKALGTDPQGVAADLNARISESLNTDGTLKTAALVITAITNAEIAAGAAIQESKLDLDVGTQDLQDQVSLNDIDIAALQASVAQLQNDFSRHVAGTAFRHDSYDIDLDSVSPSSTPPEFINLTAINVGAALIEMNDRFIAHASTTAVGAHQASNISVDGSGFTLLSTSINDVQEALEAIDQLNDIALVKHRDSMHANGFDHWANNPNGDGYNTFDQKMPLTLGGSEQGFLVTGFTDRIRFDGISAFSDFNIVQGDIIVIEDGYAAGKYILDDVGPRAGTLGGKPSLSANEAEITTSFTDGYLITDGYVDAQIFGSSSVFSFKTNGACTFHQSGATLDSMQVARPNAAKLLTLAIQPHLIDGTESIDLEAGLDTGVRSITLNNLDEDRSGPVSTVTIDTIVDRMNSLFQGVANFPAAAYRVGDELAISHNWDGYVGYDLRVLSSSTGVTQMGLDGYGANVIDKVIKPTFNSAYYVNGRKLTGFKKIVETTNTSISGAIITFTGFNPIAAGVKVGHTLHLFDHATAAENGTYFITTVTSTSVTVHASIAGTSGVKVEIGHDVVPLAAFANNTDSIILETFVDPEGQLGSNPRLTYDKTITNLNVVDLSDNFLSGSYTLVSAVTTGGHNLNIGSVGAEVFVPTGFIGQKTVYSESNVEFLIVDIVGAISASNAAVVINDHINEEEVLELATVRSNGLETLFDLADKRLFGHIGLDELREDVIQVFVENPLVELRSNGIVRGFEIITENFLDVAYQSNMSVLIRGGTSYVGGVRCDVRTQPVVFANTAGTYFITLNKIGTYQIINQTSYTYNELLDGYAGELAVIAKAVHDGSDITNTTDLRFFIDSIDDKLDIILDTTNNFIGNFKTFDAAVEYANNIPNGEKPVIRIVSKEDLAFTLPASNRELTLQIDGYVGELIVNSPVRIESRTLGNRTESHIGMLTANTGCTNIELDHLHILGSTFLTGTSGTVDVSNCFFDGYVDITSSTSVTLENSEFAGNVDIRTGNTKAAISNCSFSGSNALDIQSVNLQIINSVIDTATLLTTGGHQSIVGCEFKNHTIAGSNYGVSLTNGLSMNVESCIFKGGNFTTGAGYLRTNGASEIRGSVIGCTFDNNTLDGTSLIVNAHTISNCSFVENDYSTGTAIFAVMFDGNANITGGGGTGEVLVEARETFSNNIDFHSVVGATNELQQVTGNVFASSTVHAIGVDLATASTAETVISNNFFNIAASADGIVTGAGANDVKVSNNHFDGYDSTSDGIVVAAEKILISGNTFNNCAAISTASQINHLSVVNNKFSTVDEGWQIGDNFEFAMNTKADGYLTLSGGVTSYYTNIVGNTFKDDNAGAGIAVLAITVPLAESVFTNNNIDDFDLGANVSDMVFSNNVFNDFAATTAVTFDNVMFSQNVNVNVSSSMTWSNSTISENSFIGADCTFFMASTGGNQPALVNITTNLFSSSTLVTIDAANEIDQITFVNNISLDTATFKTITVNKHINNSFISRNISFGINIQNGSSGLTISENSMNSQNIFLLGTVNSTAVLGNSFNLINIRCNSTTGLSVSNNTIFNYISVFDSVGNYDIDRAAFNNNTIVSGGDFRIGLGMNPTDTVALTNCTINNNQMPNLNIFTSGVTSGSIDFSGNKVNGNTITTVNFADGYNNGTNYTRANVTADNNNFSGNTVATFNVGGGDNTTGTGILYNNLSISNNDITTFNVLHNVNYSNLMFSGNQLGAVSFNLRITAGATGAQNLSFVNNQVSTSFEINAGDQAAVPAPVTLDKTIISSNVMENVDVIIRNNTNDISSLFIKGLVVQGNLLRGISILNPSATSTAKELDLLGANISSNGFIGSTAAVQGVAWEPGFYLSHTGITSIQSNNTEVVISGNFNVNNSATAEIRFLSDGSGGTSISGFSISDNSDLSIVFDDANSGYFGISSGRISNNYIKGGGDLIGYTGTSTTPAAADIVISGNVGGNLVIDMGTWNINDCTISDNIANKIDLGTDSGIATVRVIGNSIETLTANGLGTMASCHFAHNTILTDCLFPPDAGWGAFNKISFNRFEAITVAGGTLNTNTNNVFWWGNTANSSPNVTLNGTIAKDVSTANDFNGGGITP